MASRSVVAVDVVVALGVAVAVVGVSVVLVGVAVGVVGVDVVVALGVAVAVVGVSVVLVGVAVGVVGVDVVVALGVAVTVMTVGVSVRVLVGVAVAVRVGVCVGMWVGDVGVVAGVDVMVDVLVTVGVTDPVAVIVGVGLGVISERMHTWTDDCRPATIGTLDTWSLEYAAASHTAGDGRWRGPAWAWPFRSPRRGGPPQSDRTGWSSPWVGSQIPTKASTTKVTSPAGRSVIITCRLAAESKGPFTATRQQVVLAGKSLEVDCSSTLTVSNPLGMSVPESNPEQASAFWDCAASVCQRTRSANPPTVSSPAPPEPPQPTAPTAHAAARATSTQRVFSTRAPEMDRSPRRASARHTVHLARL